MGFEQRNHRKALLKYKGFSNYGMHSSQRNSFNGVMLLSATDFTRKPQGYGALEEQPNFTIRNKDPSPVRGVGFLNEPRVQEHNHIPAYVKFRAIMS